MDYQAVIFDLGGVVFESPLAVIADYEREVGLPEGLVNRVVIESGPSGAWARHERGEIPRDGFLSAFADEFRRAGYHVDVEELMCRVDASIQPRPQMVAAIRRLHRLDYRLGAITNNWVPFEDHPIVSEFDVFLESVQEGVRKPEPEIYRRCLERLGVAPERTVMLDDLGPNLKPARQMGVTTIKVTSPEQALKELGETLGVDLMG